MYEYDPLFRVLSVLNYVVQWAEGAGHSLHALESPVPGQNMTNSILYPCPLWEHSRPFSRAESDSGRRAAMVPTMAYASLISRSSKRGSETARRHFANYQCVLRQQPLTVT